jgi:hypothetical protein
VTSEHDLSPVRRAERWALVEWIVVGGRRWWLLLLLVAIVALSTTLGILYADSVSRLRPNELRTLIRRREELPEPRGPLFGRVRERGSEE